MIAGVFIYSERSEQLLSRVYRHQHVDRAEIEKIRIGLALSPPIVKLAHSTLFHIRREDLCICAVAKPSANEALIFEFLNRFYTTMNAYFVKFNAEKLKKDILLVEEVLDEMIDFGYPQLTEPAALMSYINKKSIVPALKWWAPEREKEVTSQFTGHVSWRQRNIKYLRNELFVNVNERIDLVFSKNGNIISSQITGRVMMTARLSGMPQCTMTINESRPIPENVEFTGGASVGIDNCQFHQCVKLSKVAKDRKISFVPPDGRFQLMRYTTTAGFDMPFHLTPFIRQDQHHQLEITVALKSTFAAFIQAHSLRIVIPLPPQTTAVKLCCDNGRAKYKRAANTVVWKIEGMPGEKKTRITAIIDAIGVGVDSWSRAPISMGFQLPFAPSGLKIRSMKVAEPKALYSNVEVIKWARYNCQAGDYGTRF